MPLEERDFRSAGPIRNKHSAVHSGSAGRADARRRDAGDAVPSSRSGNAADARPPPRPYGLRPAGPKEQAEPAHSMARVSRSGSPTRSCAGNHSFLPGPFITSAPNTKSRRTDLYPPIWRVLPILPGGLPVRLGHCGGSGG